MASSFILADGYNERVRKIISGKFLSSLLIFTFLGIIKPTLTNTTPMIFHNNGSGSDRISIFSNNDDHQPTTTTTIVMTTFATAAEIVTKNQHYPTNFNYGNVVKNFSQSVVTTNNNDNNNHSSNLIHYLNRGSSALLHNDSLMAAILRGNTSYDYDDGGNYVECPRERNFITMILYAIVCIVGLCGNTLVIYVVLRFSKMQTVTNTYILNLAIADECYLIGIPFLLITMHIRSWKFGEYMCKAYMVSTSITQFTSSIFLLIMSADRYIAVCHPISSPRYRTPHVSKIVSAIAWLVSAILMLPVILFANTVNNNDHISCNIEWPEEHNNQSGTTFILYSLILGFATPLSFILCFYYLVIRKLHTVGPKNKSKEKKRSHRKVTKLVLTVITVYVLCWLPYWISQVALTNSPAKQCASRLEVTIFLLAGCLGYSNSAMNPILYAFLSDNFKKSFMKACTCAARKDINAQLQLENSLFPKFGKNRQSEKLLNSKKGDKRKNAKTTATTTNNITTGCGTTTTTASTETGIATTATATTFADQITSNYPPPSGAIVNCTMATPTGNIESITTAVLLVTNGENNQEGGPVSLSVSNSAQIMHTDL